MLRVQLAPDIQAGLWQGWSVNWNKLFAMDSIEDDFWRELAEIQAESLGWVPLESGAYLHVSDEQATEVLVVGVAQPGDAVLLVGCA